MSAGLDGLRLVVVEAGAGRGPEVAGALTEAGARVLLVSPDAEAVELAALLLGDGVLSLAADVRTPEGIVTLAANVPLALGSLDGIVIDAVDPPLGEPLTLTDETLRNALDETLGLPRRLLHGLLPLLPAGGTVVLLAPAEDGGADEAAGRILRAALAALAQELSRAATPPVHVEMLASAPGEGPGELASATVRLLSRG